MDAINGIERIIVRNTLGDQVLTIARLQALVETQKQEIARLTAQLPKDGEGPAGPVPQEG